MMLMNSIILSVFFASVKSEEVNYFNSSAPKINPVLYSNMTQLLKLCYSGASNPIAITENLVDTMFDNLISTVKSPILVINEDFLPKDTQFYYPTHPLYILSADTTKQLENLLILLKSSPFWNMKSTFFVIGKANKFCRDSAVILKEMWKFELLSSFVVCSKTNNRTMLYSYNPYTNRAVDSWVAVRNKENSKRRWTLYKKAFINDPKICKTLKFDKTQFMDRYPVKIITSIHGPIGFLRPVFRSLNMQVKVHPHDECCGHQTHAGFLILGDEDIAAGFYHTDMFNKDVNIIPVLYEFHYIIITQKRSFTYSFREVIAMLDYQTLFAIKSIISLIFIVIVVNNRYHVGSAFLDVFKLLLSMDMDTPFVRLSMKFLFFTATFFMFVFEPAIESQLFALLTRPQSYTIENLKDLHDHQYHVYFYEGIRKGFINERLWTTVEDMKYLHPLDKNNLDDCLELASKNNTVACVYTSHILLETALNKILHVSSKFVFIKNVFTWSRKDWALNDRVYERILNAVESGFNDEFDRDRERNVLKTIKAKNRINQLDDYDEITEANLYYAYIAFMICQIIGICTFIVERLIARFRR